MRKECSSSWLKNSRKETSRKGAKTQSVRKIAELSFALLCVFLRVLCVEILARGKKLVEDPLRLARILILAHSHSIAAGNQCGESTNGERSKETQDAQTPFCVLAAFHTNAQGLVTSA